ncbi:hypothetical protein LPB140_11490 [Sphingorhabdus lutea]|uniref:DUF2155 domain-containing protein n=1 Tax=Sphingorhabdus lutea TaxID=1913578 RepID=A0A1L3JFE6_9SPHN|nr:hypothetical protein LPB140_11490 [Sphingorhabdus lutea]
MKDRVGVVALLNKRNGQIVNLELKPGEALKYGKAVIRLRACERTAPYETYQDVGAFVQLSVLQRPEGTNNNPVWQRVFSGWLFRENPAQNVVQHKIYDVSIKDCKMSFPDDALPKSADPKNSPSKAPQSAGADASEEADSAESTDSGDDSET